MARDNEHPRHSFKNKQGSGNRRKNDQQEFETAPILYAIAREDLKEVTIRVPTENGETEKKSVSIYDGDTSKEA